MEPYIHDQLDHELADSAALPLGTVVTDAIATGTRMRRRQRLTVAASGGAALAVIATVAVFAAPYFGSGGTPGPQLAIPAASSDPVTPPPEKLAPGPSPTVTIPVPPGQKLTSGAAVISLLRDLVAPPGGISEIDRSESYDGASGSFVFDDGAGAATVSAGVSTGPAKYGPDVTGMQCPADDQYIKCQHSVTPEGLEIRIMTMGPYADATEAKNSIKDVRVEVKRPDGVYVTAEAYNGPFGHNRGATRADTILSVDQLTALAKDARWALTMDASFVDHAEAMYQKS
jgi:hypothetical protein